MKLLTDRNYEALLNLLAAKDAAIDALQDSCNQWKVIHDKDTEIYNKVFDLWLAEQEITLNLREQLNDRQ